MRFQASCLQSKALKEQAKCCTGKGKFRATWEAQWPVVRVLDTRASILGSSPALDICFVFLGKFNLLVMKF